MLAALRVVLLIDGLGTGGAERSTAELALGLRRRGHDVRVVVQHRRAGVGDELTASGVDARHLDRRSWAGRVLQLRRLLRFERPDLVHASLLSSNVLARVATWRTGVPCVCSFTGLPYAEGSPLSEHGLKRGIVRTADAWTARHLQAGGHAIGHAVADHATTHLGIPAERVTVVPRGRSRGRLGEPGPERRAAARRALGLGADADVLLVVALGRQDAVKGHAGLVAAWDDVAAELPEAHLVIAGRAGSGTAAIDAALARLEPATRARISFPGHVDDVGELLAAADVAVLPSLVEGQSGAVIEALAMGLPVVASDLPALREVLEPGRHAELVPAGDPVALAGALRGLLMDEPRRRVMGDANLQLFEERFTLDRMVDGMEALYRSVLDRGPGV